MSALLLFVPLASTDDSRISKLQRLDLTYNRSLLLFLRQLQDNKVSIQKQMYILERNKITRSDQYKQRTASVLLPNTQCPFCSHKAKYVRPANQNMDAIAQIISPQRKCLLLRRKNTTKMPKIPDIRNRKLEIKNGAMAPNLDSGEKFFNRPF